jgi:hypothetical protein
MGTPVFPNPLGFESDWGDWSAEGGAWQMGAPNDASGPVAFAGENVAGTILGGRTPASADARLSSPEFIVPAASANPRLSFWRWIALGSGDTAHVEIQSNGEWTDLGSGVVSGAPVNDWSNVVFDLTEHAGEMVRIRFRMITDSGTGSASMGIGWYVDDRDCQRNVGSYRGSDHPGNRPVPFAFGI